VSVGDWQGYRYAELPETLLARVPAWLHERTVSEGVCLREGRVYRYDECVIKFGGVGRFPRDLFRAARAIRSARMYQRIMVSVR